ncbi:MAG: hypothetical protein IPL78_12090 [Chloroflexi bacterium]|nr:hypothetical protein [Chloroflexota bacterium]
MRSKEGLQQSIQQAVIHWIQTQCQVHDVALGLIEPDEDEPERWLVDLPFLLFPIGK